jgi:hypothetical protein
MEWIAILFFTNTVLGGVINYDALLDFMREAG